MGKYLVMSSQRVNWHTWSYRIMTMIYRYCTLCVRSSMDCSWVCFLLVSEKLDLRPVVTSADRNVACDLRLLFSQCRQLRGLCACIKMVTRTPVYYTVHITTLTFSKIGGFWLVLRWLRGTECITIVWAREREGGGVTRLFLFVCH